ncbi:MAG: methyltransferase domain-containing protein [Rhodospirillaceae bacterium]|nr:methyltransferase domain-containing protein [Rhodospirillales bacterium]
MPNPKGARLLRDPIFARIKAITIERTGMAYWSDKDEALADAVAHVLERRGMPAAQWLGKLAAEGSCGVETDLLVDAVTVGETFFFRYPEQFEAIERHALPDIMARNRGRRTLSLWSAGCSNGAEPYSLSILLERDFAVKLADWRVGILATDISHTALAEAQAGIYGEWTVRDLPPEVRRECFAPLGNKWQVRSRYRKGVHFVCHNLVAEPPPLPLAGHFDLIMCRNVLMYFDMETRSRVLAGLHNVLADGGWLVVSHAEAGPQLGSQFAPVVLPSCTLYRKPPVKAVRAPVKLLPAAPAVAGPLLPEADLEALARTLLDQGEFTRAVALCRGWIDRSPLDPSPHYHLGLALEAMSEDQAIAAYRRALSLAPHLVLAHFNLLRLFQRRGERAQARRHFVAVMADLAGMPEDHKLPWATNLTAGELAAIARRLGDVP